MLTVILSFNARMTAKELLFYTDDDVEATFGAYGRTVKQAKEDIDIIKNWLKMQPHLPEIMGKCKKFSSYKL